MTMSIESAGPTTPSSFLSKAEWRAIIAASVGTIFEWYDFMLYGSLASVIASNFFGGLSTTEAFIFALLIFASGFMMRPFGAILFGRLGDMAGRKYTFLVTIVMMGFSTFCVGLLPTYESIGAAAPIILVGLRMLQGLALGGEYGGAVIYVAENSAHDRRAFNTSWIQSTAGLGLLTSLLVILATRQLTGDQFTVWGWRIPFLLSLVFLALSVAVRMRMQESPAFAKMKKDGSISKAPLTEAFGSWKNLRSILVATFGISAGMTVVWYCATLFPLFFLTQSLKVDPQQANTVVSAAIISSLPLCLLFGWISDRVGRKPMLVAGFLLCAGMIFPIFKGLTHFANPALEAAQSSAPVFVNADPSDCSFMFNPIGNRSFFSSCDVAKQTLTELGISYATRVLEEGQAKATISIGGETLAGYDGAGLAPESQRARLAAYKAAVKERLGAAGYPQSAAPDRFNAPMVFLLLCVLMILMSMTYTSVAAALVEMFPTRIRYTALSFPYHIASGWIGGLLPTMSFALAAHYGSIYAGLWYTVGWCVLSLIVVAFGYRETKDVDIFIDA